MSKISSFVVKNKIYVLFALFIILALLPGVYFYYQYQKTQNLIAGSETPAEAVFLTEKVGRLINLPKDEMPTIATIADREKLQNQDFFKKAENGDKLLIYARAKRVILYRPSTNKVIDVAPVTIGNSSAQINSQNLENLEIEDKIYKIALQNGANLSNISILESNLLQRFENIEISSRSNSSQIYQQTTVVDVSGENSAFVQQISEAVGGIISNLSSQESFPEDVDIIVIFGQDKF